jgi:cellulose synthase/poly-beta-1,6-N-acetylglucosamine synthase-like glycosyltransferase
MPQSCSLAACCRFAANSEPVEVIEPTVIAALNMNYPGSRMTIHVLDDGARPEVAAMVSRLRFQLT